MRVRFLLSPTHLIATGLGAGLAPWAPGTFGTVVAVPLYVMLRGLPLPLYAAIVAVAIGVGIWVCDATARDLGVDDHPAIVWDEVIGYLVTMTAAPRGGAWLVAGFVLFRFFDIVKPWPINLLDARVHGGLGIVLDDVLAGVLSFACIQVAAHYLG